MEFCENKSKPRLHSLPSLEDPCFEVEYHRDHPVVEAAREYLQKYKKRKASAEHDGGRDSEKNRTDKQAHEHSFRSELLKIWQLERFFDLQNNPPSPSTPNNESNQSVTDRHPDLTNFEDPWYQQTELPDLIDFTSIDTPPDCRSKCPDFTNTRRCDQYK